jgi:Peptidase family M48
MRNIINVCACILFASSPALALQGQRSFMPENQLHLEDRFADTGITEAQFNAVIDKIEKIYKPMVSQFGAKLTVERKWSDSTVNAYASQEGTNWKVAMFGGLARRPEVTEDGFAMVLCHEIGHHLGGFPYVQDWAADEGQSDMYATGACAYKTFGPNPTLSAIAEIELPPAMKDKCDANRPEAERDICYRALVAGKSLGDLLAALNNQTVSFETPDTTVVTTTNHKHPAAQCRLDTYVASAMCGNEKWDYKLIPGKSLNHESLEAQEEAFAHSCTEGDGARPSCWFAALTNDPTPPPAGECPFGDPVICDMMCQFQPDLPWCNNATR